jgi:hypothetical protein
VVQGREILAPYLAHGQLPTLSVKIFQRGLAAGVEETGSWRWVWQVFWVLKKWRSLNGARQAEPAANSGQ